MVSDTLPVVALGTSAAGTDVAAFSIAYPARAGGVMWVRCVRRWSRQSFASTDTKFGPVSLPEDKVVMTTVNADLTRLIDTAAPFWAGEAEVFRSYWESPERTRETDRQWLSRQCAKEVWGSGLGSTKGLLIGLAERIVEAFPKIDTEIDRHEVLDAAEGLWAEFAHYCAFADAHDALALDGEPKIDPYTIKERWPEDLELTELRFSHRSDHPYLGGRATRFTEGGYCTLFTEGMKLRDRTGGPHGRANTLIATACRRVYEDEFSHMLKGIAGLESEGLSHEDWQTLTTLSVDQLKLRIRMRNAQFGYPLSERRVQEILAGACPPVEFDYEKAGLVAS